MRILLAVILLSGVVMIAGCKKNVPADGGTANDQPSAEVQTVQQNDTVRVDYVGTLTDGEVFDTNIAAIAQENEIYNELRPYEPLEFTVGAGQMIPGFDQGVVGMKVGETKKLEIAPADGYGDIREELVQEIAKADFEEAGITPTVGETYNFGIAQGTVLEVSDTMVKMDFNHSLAGKTLYFEVTLKEIVAPVADAPVVE